jgi:predicted dehydrogenase
VIGGGSIGERHVRCFQQTGRAEISLCEINDTVRRRVASTYSLSQQYADFDSALASKPEVAVICTPAHLHVPMAIRLAETGAHLLIEKPLSTSTDDIEKLRSSVVERRLLAGVAYVSRSHPALAAMKQEIDNGRFGRPVQVVVISGQHFPFYRPAYRETYYTDRASGGGAIQDALTHMVNATEWLVGPITSLAADADHLVLDGVDVEDTVHVIARHEKVLASYSLNQHQAPSETAITVICERGTARFEAHASQWLSAVEPGQDWKVESQFNLERDDLFIRQANRFLDVVEGTATPACSLDDALQTLRVNLAILRAVEDKRWHILADD